MVGVGGQDPLATQITAAQLCWRVDVDNECDGPARQLGRRAGRYGPKVYSLVPDGTARVLLPQRIEPA
jgi:hypothetical protein